MLCFNTSHVVVYHEEAAQHNCKTIVSIHLMLQFIARFNNVDVSNVEFQYISCCSLSFPAFWKNLSRLVSIHLMLQFILVTICLLLPRPTFQYISCCSLSKLSAEFGNGFTGFQYISCCSLSKIQDDSWINYVLFQYISCCSLSG